jgi:hypothetical protein
VTYAPSQRIGNAVADMLMAAGMQPYTANDLTSRVGNVVMASPLGVPGAAADALYAKSRGDDVGTLLAMAGMLPGAGPEIRAASGEIRSGINGARQASGLFDLSRLHEVPNVRQFDLPRYAPPRGVPARVLDVTSDSQFRKKMFGVIEQGRGMGGVSWYNTEPLRDKFVAEA